jgi:Nod factor-specific ABC transporter NodJ protein
LRIKGAFRVWQRNFDVYRKLYKTSLVLNFVEPVLYLTAMGLGLGAFVSSINGMPYVNFIAPGMIASSAIFAAAYECTYGTYVRMTFQKTFEAIMATPVGVDEITVAEVSWGAFKSLLYGTIIMIVIAVFGLVDSWLILAAIPVVFLGGLMFSELCVIFTSLVQLFLHAVFNAHVPFLGDILPAGRHARIRERDRRLYAALPPCARLPRMCNGGPVRPSNQHRLPEHRRNRPGTGSDKAYEKKACAVRVV